MNSSRTELHTFKINSRKQVKCFFPPGKVKMAAGKARIGHLAPGFTAKAVMPDGQFKDISMSDYRGW